MYVKYTLYVLYLSTKATAGALEFLDKLHELFSVDVSLTIFAPTGQSTGKKQLLPPTKG